MQNDMREKLIELLSQYFDIGDSYFYNLSRAKTAFEIGTMSLEDFEEFDEETVADIADNLIANGVTVENEWISVKDRLPEKDQYVWCYSNKYGGHFFMGYRGYYTGEWMENGCLHIGEVTHWIPLPEPPIKKEE